MKSRTYLIIGCITCLFLLIWFFSGIVNQTEKPLGALNRLPQSEKPSTPDTAANISKEVKIGQLDHSAPMAASTNENIPKETDNSVPTNKENIMTEDALIRLALEEASKGTLIPSEIVPKVTYNDNIARIVWEIKPTSDVIVPRGDYYALVEIDRKTGKILKLWGAP